MPYEKTIQVVRQALSETLVELETWFEQPEESRSYRPQDGGWSIQAILEHITLTTHYSSRTRESGTPSQTWSAS